MNRKTLDPKQLLLAVPLALLPLAAHAETVEVDGLDIWYETTGDVTATTPFLLLHGGVTTAEMSFGALRPRLAENRPVIVIEQQAHGHTGDRDAPITLASMRADTLGVLDALGVEKVHVVGYSLGGMLGLDLAVNAPDRLASLTAISASADSAGMHPAIVAMNEDPSMAPPPEVVDLLPTKADFAEMQKGYANNPDGPETMDAALTKLHALLTGDWGFSAEDLAAIDLPVLLVIGDRDFVLPQAAVEMARTIPDAQLAILPGTTHMETRLRDDWLKSMIEERIAPTD